MSAAHQEAALSEMEMEGCWFILARVMSETAAEEGIFIETFESFNV